MVNAELPMKSDCDGRGVFLSWVSHHGRSQTLAEALNLDPVFIKPTRSHLGLMGRYVGQFFATVKELRRRRPNVVVLMLPPFPALLAVIVSMGSTKSIVGDLHTGFFYDPKWKWARRISLWLLRASPLIVTNQRLAGQCHSANVTVMHDLLERSNVVYGDEVETSRPTILCPLSYANDEPITELLMAAKIAPDIDFIFTGKAPNTIISAAPPNVRFSGYISESAYWQEFSRSWAIVALTTRPDTMQRAGYEALIYNKPLLTSDMEVLRQFFGDAAIYCRPDASAIANGIKQVLLARESIRPKSAALLSFQRSLQKDGLVAINAQLSEIVRVSARVNSKRVG